MIVKVSASGKQFQVIDDDGCVFGTSVTFLKGLLDGRAPSGFVLMTKMPFKVAKSRYKPSPVWLNGEKQVVDGDVLKASQDAQSVKVVESRKVSDELKKDVTL